MILFEMSGDCWLSLNTRVPPAGFPVPSRLAGRGQEGMRCPERVGAGGGGPAGLPCRLAQVPRPPGAAYPAQSGAGPGGAAGGERSWPGRSSPDAGCSARYLVGPEASRPPPSSPPLAPVRTAAPACPER